MLPKQALEGIRVLDVSNVLAAPVTATMLGDFGAEVIKVEEPTRGDFTRANTGSDRVGGRSLQWVQEGRNKQSLSLDLRSERGREILRDLIPHFDVVVTNYRPPTLEKWGLDGESLQRINPRAVLVYITGYGLTGPNRDRGAFDRIASAYAGLTYTSGEANQFPVRSGYSVIDYMAAYLAAFATATALYHRDLHGGPGQVIDLALYEAGFRASEDALLDFEWQGAIRERLGNINPNIAPASDFTASDGKRVAIHAGTDPLFRRLTAVMGAPELLTDERFAERGARLTNQDQLYRILDTWAATLDSSTIVARLNDAGVPASQVMSIADISQDAHYRERGTIVDVEDADFGPLRMAAPLPKMSETPGRIRSLGPTLGEHSHQVLARFLGTSAAEFQQLVDAGVTSAPSSPSAEESR